MESRKWENLPPDCLANVFLKVGLQSLATNVPLVCKPWYKASLDPHSWRHLYFPFDSSSKQIRFAVDRSCGTAIYLSFPGQCSADDLVYVFQRCPGLEFLSMPCFLIKCSCKQACSCEKTQAKKIIKLFSSLKELEVLHLGTVCFFEEIIRTASINCKKLVGLMLIGRVGPKEAYLIASLLPKIKYLSLKEWCTIPRDCFLLILAGCRDLVDLDASYCFGLTKGDQLEIIKNARHIKRIKIGGRISTNFV